MRNSMSQVHDCGADSLPKPTSYDCLWAECQALSLHRGTVPVDRLNRLRRLYLVAEPHIPTTSPEWCDALLLIAAARSLVHAGGTHEALVMLQTVLHHMAVAARPKMPTPWYAE